MTCEWFREKWSKQPLDSLGVPPRKLITKDYDLPPVDYCPMQAVVSVGTGLNNFHLCDECSKSPSFKRYRKRVKL